MLDQLRRNWWMLLVRGVAGISFGVAALLWPGLGLAALITLFGLYAMIDGVVEAGIVKVLGAPKELAGIVNAQTPKQKR